MLRIQQPLLLSSTSRPTTANKPKISTMATTANKPKISTMATTASSTNNQSYDRNKEVQQFDDSKLGVKGLLDSGLTSIPRFFIQPPEILSGLKPKADARPDPDLIPTIDLSGPRAAVVEQVSRACREFGFFQIVNHGVPVEAIDSTIGAIKGFHELPAEEKMQWYRRDTGTGVSYLSNIDLFQSNAASWRDTLQMKLGPTLPELEHIPEICRKEAIEWSHHTKELGEVLLGLLCEGLGLHTDRLKDLTFSESRMMAAHYYPYCPQPDLTIGIKSHTDPGVLTILLQNHVGGLQVKHGDDWIDVKPVPGAIVINVGDILQIMSNEEYKSNEHRVLANGCVDPRVTVAVFLNPVNRDCLYGPFPELISEEKPALYRQFDYKDYMRRFFTKELDGKSLTNYYKL